MAQEPKEEEAAEKWPAQPEPPLCVMCSKPLDRDDSRFGYTACDECRHSRRGEFYDLWLVAESWFKRQPDTLTERTDRHFPNPAQEFPKAWETIEHFSCRLFGHPEFTGGTWQRMKNWLSAEYGLRKNSLVNQPVDHIIELLRAVVDRKEGNVPPAVDVQVSPADSGAGDEAEDATSHDGGRLGGTTEAGNQAAPADSGALEEIADAQPQGDGDATPDAIGNKNPLRVAIGSYCSVKATPRTSTASRKRS